MSYPRLFVRRRTVVLLNLDFWFIAVKIHVEVTTIIVMAGFLRTVIHLLCAYLIDNIATLLCDSFPLLYGSDVKCQSHKVACKPDIFTNTNDMITARYGQIRADRIPLSALPFSTYDKHFLPSITFGLVFKKHASQYQL